MGNRSSKSTPAITTPDQFRTELLVSLGGGGGEGDSHIKRTGVLVGNFPP